MRSAAKSHSLIYLIQIHGISTPFEKLPKTWFFIFFSPPFVSFPVKRRRSLRMVKSGLFVDYFLSKTWKCSKDFHTKVQSEWDRAPCFRLPFSKMFAGEGVTCDQTVLLPFIFRRRSPTFALFRNKASLIAGWGLLHELPFKIQAIIEGSVNPALWKQ